MPREDTQYFIKDMIVFNVLDNTLWAKENPEDTLTIGLVPGRLFRYLLANAGRVVSKDELFSNVWNEYGLRSSGHSLNQNISLLRKSLTSLGCESEVISTLPRLGYLINNDVVDVQYYTAVKADPPETIHRPKLTSSHYPKQLLTAGFLSLTLLIPATFFLTQSSSYISTDIPVQSLEPINDLEGCPVFTTKPGIQAHKKLYVLARELIADSLPPCPDNVFYIISADDSVIMSGTSGRVFLTRCLYDAKTKIISGCDTIYDRNHSEKN